MKKIIVACIQESITVKEKLLRDDLINSVEKLARLVIACLKKGGKLILFGNGGSASDAEHIAAELIGRFTKERGALAAIALGCSSANLTCIGNDYDFRRIFSRQIAGLGQNKDLAIGISTSGNSPNIIAGIYQAKKMGLKTAALTSEKGKRLAAITDVAVCIPSQNTARIQEAHITIGHIICELTEKALFK